MGQIHVKFTRHSNGHLTLVHEGYMKLTNSLWNPLYYVAHVLKPTARYAHWRCMATLHVLTRSLHITLGVHMEMHAPLNHHSVLPYMHEHAADANSMDWYVSPWFFLQTKRYVSCICYRPYLHNSGGVDWPQNGCKRNYEKTTRVHMLMLNM